MKVTVPSSPGRPPGPREGRGQRPWDPRHLTRKECLILDYVAAYPDLPRWLVAERFGISISRLSVLTCSPVGRRYMAEVGELGLSTADEFQEE